MPPAKRPRRAESEGRSTKRRREKPTLDTEEDPARQKAAEELYDLKNTPKATLVHWAKGKKLPSSGSRQRLVRVLFDQDLRDEDEIAMDMLRRFKSSGDSGLEKTAQEDDEEPSISASTIKAKPKAAEPHARYQLSKPAQDREPKYKTNRDDATATMAPSERRLLNAKYQGFPEGEIQHGRASKALRITWNIHYADEDVGQNRICFDSAEPYLGGPFHFLSIFHRCKFNIPETGTFHVDEQPYQLAKALCMSRLGKERFAKEVTYDGGKISSKDLPAHILAAKDSDTITALGSAFESLRDLDPRWWASWNPLWQRFQPRILYLLTKAKFTDNPDLQDKLMMTGHFSLSYSSKHDRDTGTGFHARDEIRARKSPEKSTRIGTNILGGVLEQVREEIRKERKRSREYAFWYWTTCERLYNYDRERRLPPSEQQA